MMRTKQIAILFTACPLLAAGNCDPHLVVRDAAGTTNWFENGTQVGGTTPDNDATLANTYAVQTATFFQAWKDVGPKDPYLTVLVNAPVSNATGDSTDATHARIRLADDYVTLDVVGHEATHGAIQLVERRRSSLGFLLPYSFESGAVNEGVADVVGELIECVTGCDWLHREDYCGANAGGDASAGCACATCTGGTPPAAGVCGPNRDLDTPTACGMPEHRDDATWSTASCAGCAGGTPCAACDFGGVHTNSALMALVGALLNNGGTHMGITVARVGDLSLLLRDTLDSCGSSPADYDAWATCMRASAQAGAERDSVSAAFCSVGIGPAGGATDPDCRDADGDNFVALVDCNDTVGTGAPIFPGAPEICDGIDQDCDGVPDNGLPDLNKNGICDSLDPDRDGDCVRNEKDLCPDTASCGYYAPDADKSLCHDPCALGPPAIAQQVIDALKVCSFHQVPRQCLWDGCPFEMMMPSRELAVQFGSYLEGANIAGTTLVGSGPSRGIQFGRGGLGGDFGTAMNFGGFTSIDACASALGSLPKFPGALDEERAKLYAKCVEKMSTEQATCNADTDGDGKGDACEP